MVFPKINSPLRNCSKFLGVRKLLKFNTIVSFKSLPQQRVKWMKLPMEYHSKYLKYIEYNVVSLNRYREMQELFDYPMLILHC